MYGVSCDCQLIAEMLKMKQELEYLKKQTSKETDQTIKKERETVVIKTGQRKRTAHSPDEMTSSIKRRKVGVANSDESCDTERFTGLRIKYGNYYLTTPTNYFKTGIH